MNPVLEKLITLQHLADQIKRHSTQCADLPKQIENLDKQLAGAVDKVDSVKRGVKANEERIRKNERAIEDARDQQGKYRTQLFKLKSNREYKALNSEIELLGDKISQSETVIIEAMESIDKAASELKDAEVFLKQEKERIGQQKALLEADLKEENRRLEEAESEYQLAYGSLDESIRNQFDRLVRKNGRGLAELDGKNCGNCFVKVQPRIAATVFGNAELVNCDKCGVFLYQPELKE